MAEKDKACAKCGEKAPAKKKSVLKIVLLSLAGVVGALLLVVGIIAAIVIPKFHEMSRGSEAGSTKGSLGSLRGEIEISYSDTNGKYPDFEYFASDKFKNYMPVLPKEKITNSNKLVNKFDGTGGWYYCDDLNSAD